MKKYSLLLAFSSIASFTFAQFDDTKYVLGGTVNYGANQNNVNSGVSLNREFGIAPSIAKVINSSSLVGIELGYRHYKSESVDNIHVSTTINYSLGAYYQPFYPISEKIFFNWRAKGGVGKYQNTNEFEFSASENSIVDLNIGVNPGLSWQVMDRLLLSATIGGAQFSKSLYQTTNNEQYSWSFNISFNQPSFSFNYLLK